MKRFDSLLKKISGLNILVVGDLMLDHYIWGDATRISPEAPVPVVDIARDSWTAGGAANVALNIASLGAGCTVAGAVGEDEAGERLVGILRDHSISTLRTPGTGMTIVKTRVMVQHQQLCRLDRESAPASYAFDLRKAKALFSRAIAKADAVILSDYAKGVLSEDLVSWIALEAHSRGKHVALDPKPKRALAFQGLDLITPNRREALQLAGVDQPQGTPFPAAEVCRRLDERFGTRNVVITLGEDGMLLSSGGKVLRTIPTAAREVYDVSGAGDTALAALVLGLAAGATLVDAAHFANAAAGVVVAKLGTATVTPKELIDYTAKTP